MIEVAVVAIPLPSPVEAIEKRLKRPVLGVVPNDYRSVTHAIDIGEPVSAKSPMRTAIAEIAASLAGINAAEDTGGWLSRFSRKKQKAPIATGRAT